MQFGADLVCDGVWCQEQARQGSGMLFQLVIARGTSGPSVPLRNCTQVPPRHSAPRIVRRAPQTPMVCDGLGGADALSGEGVVKVQARGPALRHACIRIEHPFPPSTQVPMPSVRLIYLLLYIQR